MSSLALDLCASRLTSAALWPGNFITVLGILWSITHSKYELLRFCLFLWKHEFQQNTNTVVVLQGRCTLVLSFTLTTLRYMYWSVEFREAANHCNLQSNNYRLLYMENSILMIFCTECSNVCCRISMNVRCVFPYSFHLRYITALAGVFPVHVHVMLDRGILVTSSRRDS